MRMKGRREIRGRSISVSRHLLHLYPFMDMEKAVPQKLIPGLEEGGATGSTGTTAPDTITQHLELRI